MINKSSSNKNTVKAIAKITGNESLALSINAAITSALNTPFIRLQGGGNVLDVFNRSLSTAVRDIETHPSGMLLRRLIEYGHLHPDDPADYSNERKEALSDVELGRCVEFIYSHMINRFKGELAELLALSPCCNLLARCLHERSFPAGTLLYWGETIQERNSRGYYARGADGLFVKHVRTRNSGSSGKVIVQGVIEIKSMIRPLRTVLHQVDKHITRLKKGLSLNNCQLRPEDVYIVNPKPLRVIVLPSKWKLSREYGSNKYTGQGLHRAVFKPGSRPDVMVFPVTDLPIPQQQIVQVESDLWEITLSWSHEALAQAAFEMTFWYMGQIGRAIYTDKPKPEYLAYMTPEEIGMNRVKEMLRNAPLRPLTDRQYKRAMWLYNVYCFGYPLGSDSRDMLFLPGEGV